MYGLEKEGPCMAVDALTVRAPRDVDPAVLAPTLDAVPVSTHASAGLAVSHSERFAVRTRGVAPAFFDGTDVVLGRWQRLLLVELDHPRPRELTVQVTGIAPAGMAADRDGATH